LLFAPLSAAQNFWWLPVEAPLCRFSPLIFPFQSFLFKMAYRLFVFPRDHWRRLFYCLPHSSDTFLSLDSVHVFLSSLPLGPFFPIGQEQFVVGAGRVGLVRFLFVFVDLLLHRVRLRKPPPAALPCTPPLSCFFFSGSAIFFSRRFFFC